MVNEIIVHDEATGSVWILRNDVLHCAPLSAAGGFLESEVIPVYESAYCPQANIDILTKSLRETRSLPIGLRWPADK